MSGSESRSVASGMHSAKEELYTNIITVYKLLVYEFIKVSSTRNAQSSDKDSYGFCQVFHQKYELQCVSIPGRYFNYQPQCVLYQADILIINHNVFLYHADILIINHSVFLFPLCGIMSYRSLVELSRLRDGIMYNFQSNTFVNHRNQGSV
jgi:hypothetical protein